MGGFGSGRKAEKVLVGSVRQIDVNQLKRDGHLDQPCDMIWIWNHGGGRTATIRLATSREQIALSYRCGWDEDSMQDMDYVVPIVWAACPFGGERPFFECLGPRDGRCCGQRVTRIYQVSRLFLCRHCNRMAYPSQNETALDRAYRRETKIKRRLGLESRMDQPLFKPKGMHQATFDRLRAEAVDAEMAAEDLFVEAAHRLVGRYRKQSGRR